MKIEIDITEEQIEELRTNSYDHCFGKNSVLKQIIDKLPPKQKRWRFYKGNFSIDENRKNNPDGLIAFSVRASGNLGEPAYCFTKEQLREAFIDSRRTMTRKCVDDALDEFLNDVEIRE